VTTPPPSGRADPATARLAGWWEELAAVHREVALAHQHDRLSYHGALEAFEAAAGRTDVPPTVGFPTFISDSDVHKWLDAVARSLPAGIPEEVVARFDAVVELITAAQAEDGYLNTWVQTMFGAGRFAHLLTEHELYTVGHLVEAGVSLVETTGDHRLLDVALRAVEAVRRAVATWDPGRQDGHAELELALLRLARSTGDEAARRLGLDLLARRGTARRLRRQALADHLGTGRRLLHQRMLVRRRRRTDPAWRPRPRAAGHEVAVTPSIGLRAVRSFASGRHWQNDRPVRRLTEPSGHSVAFHYLQTAMAMAAADTGYEDLRAVGEAAWEQEVAGHLYVTGGAGAYPALEGFAEPFDLDPERAYCETCAGISGVLWNRALAELTGDARYEDLAEWQLLNAVAVGMSVDGTRYGYDNPLQVRTAAHRAGWYPVPCCPSNLSRTWASLAAWGTSLTDGELRIGQYVARDAEVGGVRVWVEGELPWSGRLHLRLDGEGLPERVALRVPSWSEQLVVRSAGRVVELTVDPARPSPHTASGLGPHRARWARLALDGLAGPGDGVELEVEVDVPIRLLRQDDRVPRVGGRHVVTRGPLVYCLEGVDHPGRDVDDLFSVGVDPATLRTEPADDLPFGALALVGSDRRGGPLRFVPYFLWGNRAPGPMTVFVDRV